MGFSSKRGRPASSSLKVIEGGKQIKSAESKKPRMHITREPIDICQKKGLITSEEHWAAIHFRWLYTIKFGAPGISALEYDKMNAHGPKITDPLWQEMREREYAMAVEKLRKSGALKIVLNIAVFGYLPGFLSHSGSNRRYMNNNYSEITKLREGLDLLVKHWNFTGQKPI